MMLKRVNPLIRAGVSLAFILAATVVGSWCLLAWWLATAVAGVLVCTSLRPALLLKRMVPFFLIGLGFLWMNLLFHRSGDVSVGLCAGMLLMLRALVFGGFSIFFVTDLDHELLAASLIRYLRAPPRVVYAALIAFRLGPVLAEDRRSIATALMHRSSHVPPRVRDKPALWAHQTVGLFVSAVRRASRIAVAFEARGLDDGPRSFRCPPCFHRRDLWFVLGSVLYVAATWMALGGQWWSGGFTG